MTICRPPTDNIVSPVYVGPGFTEGASIGANDPYYPVDPCMLRLMRHYRQQSRGRNLFLMSDGSVVDSQIGGTPPNMIQPPTDPFAVVFDASQGSLSPPPGPPVVTQFFQTPYVTAIMYGGCDNPVTPAQVTQLTNAGYGSTIH